MVLVARLHDTHPHRHVLIRASCVFSRQGWDGGLCGAAGVSIEQVLNDGTNHADSGCYKIRLRWATLQPAGLLDFLLSYTTFFITLVSLLSHPCLQMFESLTVYINQVRKSYMEGIRHRRAKVLRHVNEGHQKRKNENVPCQVKMSSCLALYHERIAACLPQHPSRPPSQQATPAHVSSTQSTLTQRIDEDAQHQQPRAQPQLSLFPLQQQQPWAVYPWPTCCLNLLPLPLEQVLELPRALTSSTL